MEVSVTIRKNSVDNAINYEQRVGQKSCDELLLARKQWEFSCNLNVRWSSRVPKSSRQENGDRGSPEKTEKEDGNPNRSEHNGVVVATSPR